MVDTITKSKIREMLNNKRSSMIIAVAVVVVVVAAGFTVLQLRAAGFFATADASQASVSTNAQLVNDPSAYGGRAIQFNAPPATPPPPPPPGSSNCALPNYPNQNCTGVPTGVSLTTHNGDYSAKSNEVITGKRITGNVEIAGNNITIKNSEIYGEIKNNGSSNNRFTVEDSTVGAPTGCNSEMAAVGHNNFTMNRVYVRNFGEGPRLSDGDNVVIRDSFIKLCNPGGDAHSDGIQGYFGGNDILIEHNTIDTIAAMETITANIFWSDDSGNNVQFKNNMLAGGGYTIRIHSGTGHTVSGNKVVNNSWYYGPVSSNCGAINWSNNSLVEVNASYQVTKTIKTFECEE